MAIIGIPTTAGNDTVTITPTGGYSVDGLAGTDLLVLNLSSLGADISYSYIGSSYYRYTDDVRTTVDFVGFERFDITGGAGDDLLVGRDLNDRLVGGLGNDRIESGLGADTVQGGGGTDRWVANYTTLASPISVTLLSVGTATVVGSGATLNSIEAISLDTGAGADAINTEAYSGNDAVSTGSGDDLVALGRGVDSANGGDDVDTLRMDWSGITDPNAAITNSYLGSSWYRYAAGGDRTDYVGFERFHLIGGAGGDVLYGGALNDTLVGNAGNDLLDSGSGVDQVAGGNGVDVWRIDTSARLGTTVIDLEAQTTNFGAVLSGIERIHYTGGNAVDRVTALPGIFNDVIATGDANDTVKTGRGVDSADGGLGGGDKLIMDWSGISDARHGISQTYIGSGWYQFASASGDQLSHLGFETFDMTGGAGDDSLTGGALNDTLRGGAGDDTLYGGQGDGVVEGGAGDDLWSADLSPQGATLFDAVLSQTVAQVTGLGLSVTGIERLSLTTGNGADKISTAGYALNDWIAVSGGSDTVNLGRGFDTVDGGAGTDLMVLDYSGAASAVSNVYVGSGWYRYGLADGSASLTWINMDRFKLTGGLGNDALSGGALADTLTGNEGNDVLNGYRGADSIVGGAGTDTWIGDYSNMGTAVTLALSASGYGTVTGAGTKLVGIENISLITGAGADVIDLSAAQGSDTVSTGVGDDTVHMGRGIYDSANGGDGTDRLTIDASLATAGLRMWYIGSGWERIQATDGSYTADMTLFEHFTFLGSSRSDRVYGFGGADTLDGRAGVDFLNGGQGDDVLTGGTGADLFIFSDLWNAGVDRITDGAAGDLIRLSGLGLSGAVAAGSGATALAGQVQVSSAGGVSTLHIGLDATAGADLAITLNGTYGAGSFSLSGSDILFV